MNTIKNLGSTGIYAYTTLISVFICAPGIFIYEKVRGRLWTHGAAGGMEGSGRMVGLFASGAQRPHQDVTLGAAGHPACPA